MPVTKITSLLLLATTVNALPIRELQQCIDSGPWACSNDACTQYVNRLGVGANGQITCAVFAAVDRNAGSALACDNPFALAVAGMGASPPAGMTAPMTVVKDLCPVSCGVCTGSIISPSSPSTSPSPSPSTSPSPSPATAAPPFPPPTPASPPPPSLLHLSFMAAGDVSLYDEAKKLEMRQIIADFLLVVLSMVQIEVFAGSVIIEATVKVPAADAESKKAELESGFGTRALLASQLNVTAVSEPTISTLTIGTTAGDDDKLSGGVIAAIVILVLAFVVLVPLVAYYLRQKDAKGNGSTVTVTSNTKQAPPSQPDSQ